MLMVGGALHPGRPVSGRRGAARRAKSAASGSWPPRSSTAVCSPTSPDVRRPSTTRRFPASVLERARRIEAVCTTLRRAAAVPPPCSSRFRHPAVGSVVVGGRSPSRSRQHRRRPGRRFPTSCGQHLRDRQAGGCHDAQRHRRPPPRLGPDASATTPGSAPQHGPLHRSFLADEAAEALRAAGVAVGDPGAGRGLDADTRYLLDVAAHDLLGARRRRLGAARRPATWPSRHSPTWSRPASRRRPAPGARRPAGRLPGARPTSAHPSLSSRRGGLAFDVPTPGPGTCRPSPAWPMRFPSSRSCSTTSPSRRAAPRRLADWESALRAAAATTRTWWPSCRACKHVGQPFTVDALRPVCRGGAGCLRVRPG